MGCGSCTAECPAKAITLRHYVDCQVLAAVDSLLGTDAHERPLEPVYPEQVGVALPRWHKSLLPLEVSPGDAGIVSPGDAGIVSPGGHAGIGSHQRDGN